MSAAMLRMTTSDCAACGVAFEHLPTRTPTHCLACDPSPAGVRKRAVRARLERTARRRELLADDRVYHATYGRATVVGRSPVTAGAYVVTFDKDRREPKRQFKVDRQELTLTSRNGRSLSDTTN